MERNNCKIGKELFITSNEDGDCLTRVEYEYIGECNGNDNNGCFMDSPGHNCGCFVRKPNTK